MFLMLLVAVCVGVMPSLCCMLRWSRPGGSSPLPAMTVTSSGYGKLVIQRLAIMPHGHGSVQISNQRLGGVGDDDVDDDGDRGK